MLKSYKYRMYPTEDQKVLLAKTFGCVRVVYNKALELKTSVYQTEKKGLSRFDLTGRVTAWKKEEEYRWLGEVNSQALQASIQNLDTAFTNFFRNQARYPKFKSKGGHQSFRNVQGTRVLWDEGKIGIPKFKGGIRTVLHRRFEGEVRSSTVSLDKAGRYFISVLTEDGEENPVPQKPCEETTLGVDLGLKHFAVFDSGEKVDNPSFLKKGLRRIKKLSCRHSRKKKGGNNRRKARVRLARAHAKVADQRKDFLHKLTARITESKGYTGVAIEDLAVGELVREGGGDAPKCAKRGMSRCISDAGWGTFRSMLEYKCARRGKNLHVIGRFEPSSRICTCGYHNRDLRLGDREWECPSCGSFHDRDVLAANNIKRFAFREQNTKFIGADCSEFTLGEIGHSPIVEPRSPRIYSGE